MTKKQIETIIQENMQKIYLYCVKRLENTDKRTGDDDEITGQAE